MAFTDERVETKPLDSESIGQGASRIREQKRAERERLAVDHLWESTEASVNIGKHNQVSLIEKAVDADAPTAGIVLYDKNGALMKRGKTGAPVEIMGDGTITEGMLADGAVTEGKLAADAVTTAKIKDGEVTTAKLADKHSPATMSSDTGSCTLPNGLILKWGNTTGTGTTETVVFPVAFPVSCFTVVACGGGSGSTSENVNTWSITKTSFIIKHGSGERPARWFAIGY